jgi:hypothetical protein
MTHEVNDKHDSSGEPADKPGELPDEVLLVETAPLSGKTILTLLKETLPLIGFLLLPAFALRALIAARFDVTVATALVQYTQPLNFVLAFLVSTVPPLICVMGSMVLFWSGLGHQLGIPDKFYSLIGAAFFALVLSAPLLMIAFVPKMADYMLILLLYLAAYSAGLIQCIRVTRWNRNKIANDLATARFFYLFLVLVVFMLPYRTYQGAIWLAPETLTIRGIPETQYVLQQQGRDLIVYDPDFHAVMRVPTADVTHRQFCNVQSFTLAERLFGGPEGRPLCPK